MHAGWLSAVLFCIVVLSSCDDDASQSVPEAKAVPLPVKQQTAKTAEPPTAQRSAIEYEPAETVSDHGPISVYKCKRADGRTEFSDQPCVGDHSEKIKVEAATIVDNSNLREKAKAWKKIDDAEQEIRRSSPEAILVRDDSGNVASHDCLEARRLLNMYDSGRLNSAAQAARARIEAEAACGQKLVSGKENAAQKQSRSWSAGQQRLSFTRPDGTRFEPVEGGYVNIKTGEFYSQTKGGIVNTKTGHFIPVSL